MDEQRQDNQLEPTYSSSVPIRNVALKTCRKQRTIGRGDDRGSGISVLMVRHDEVDEIYMTWFGWVYGISTIVGYLMLNPVYTYIVNIYDL